MPPENFSLPAPNPTPNPKQTPKIIISVIAVTVIILGGVIFATSNSSNLRIPQPAQAKKATAKQAALYKEEKGVPISNLLEQCLSEVDSQRYAMRKQHQGSLPKDYEDKFNKQTQRCQDQFS
jgi:hypothetical protein